MLTYVYIYDRMIAEITKERLIKMYWLDKLREFKTESGLTYKEIADRTGIALTTIEKLFSGRTGDPKLNTASRIVRLMGHEVSELVGSTNVLSDYEQKTVNQIRKLDALGKTRVSDTIKSELRRVEAEKNATITYSRIYYDFPVSAGTGEYLDNRTAVIAELSAEPPKDTDYILRISGDSMEPEFSDGDYVYVNSQYNIDVGEIGIFVAEGSVYMKEYTKDGLKSLNPRYPLMRFYESIHCLGKVIGKMEGTIEIPAT